MPYATSGNAWPHPELITISFVPDGTKVGTDVNNYDVKSNLFATLNARYGSPSAWQNQILKAAQQWAQQTNINFAVVNDSGADLGSGDNQQGDPKFGDIRVGGYVDGSGILAQAYMPPPVNNQPYAGDVLFNTGVAWNVGGTYDPFTVATAASPAVPLSLTTTANGADLCAGGGQATRVSDQARANTTSTGQQYLRWSAQHPVGIDANGNCVVVWSSQGQDGSGWGVYGQRYKYDGTAQGGEFRVTTTSATVYDATAVVMDGKSHAVIAWSGSGANDSDGGVFFERFNTKGGSGMSYMTADAFGLLPHDHGPGCGCGICSAAAAGLRTGGNHGPGCGCPACAGATATQRGASVYATLPTPEIDLRGLVGLLTRDADAPRPARRAADPAPAEKNESSTAIGPASAAPGVTSAARSGAARQARPRYAAPPLTVEDVIKEGI